MEELSAKLMRELAEPPEARPICNGTLLSRVQYLSDITSGGFIDARTTGRSMIERHELQELTKASLK